VGQQGPNVRVTRIRSDIAHAAMTEDFLLQASSDQSELSNIRNVTKSVNLTCPVYQSCSSVGCAAASPSEPHRGWAALGVAGMLGLFVGRIIRARRRASRT
jgi:MYXO-CTERM domain-containing protein